MVLSTLSRVFLKSAPAPLPFSYEIKRSLRRRSMSIEVSCAQVVVRAPQFVAVTELDAFIRSKAAWVQQKLAEQAQQLQQLPVRRYEDGGSLPFLGDEVRLVVRRHTRSQVIRQGQSLLVLLGSRSRLDEAEQVRRLVAGWYQQQAMTLLVEKTRAAAGRLGMRYGEISLRATRSKWGHCTTKGDIQYNWQILLAPEPIVDYLVAHEVSHLVHHNHSPAFWAVVASLCPDYRQRRAWLKANGMFLTL
jgi:predicted metal-dependent hydrolase